MSADQIARYHEENIDPGKTARDAGVPGMEQHDRADGDGAQAVDVGTIGGGIGTGFGGDRPVTPVGLGQDFGSGQDWGHATAAW
ncbi:hypothetical protein [Sphingomonas sp.]|uniref:hypothetical protein n=1 Tax=Sphingomonas sp. TaxID=28214 RepID=UPI0025F2BF5B|nr:hypothetical protein [Sphingomonas sp.]